MSWPSHTNHIRWSTETKILTIADFGGVDIGIHQAMRRSTGFAANSHGSGAG
jgi:hypothetical protein